MSTYMDTHKFEALRDELSERLEETIRDFAADHELSLDSDALWRQNDINPDERSSKILHFGLDVWPKSIEGDDSGSNTPRGSRGARTALSMACVSAFMLCDAIL